MGMIQTRYLNFFVKTEFFLSYNLGQDSQNPHPAHLVPHKPLTHSDQSVRLQSCYLCFFFGGGGGEGGVSVLIIAIALKKGFILKRDMAASIFLSIFI